MCMRVVIKVIRCEISSVCVSCVSCATACIAGLLIIEHVDSSLLMLTTSMPKTLSAFVNWFHVSFA